MIKYQNVYIHILFFSGTKNIVLNGNNPTTESLKVQKHQVSSYPVLEPQQQTYFRRKIYERQRSRIMALPDSYDADAASEKRGKKARNKERATKMRMVSYEDVRSNEHMVIYTTNCIDNVNTNKPLMYIDNSNASLYKSETQRPRRQMPTSLRTEVTGTEREMSVVSPTEYSPNLNRDDSIPKQITRELTLTEDASQTDAGSMDDLNGGDSESTGHSNRPTETQLELAAGGQEYESFMPQPYICMEYMQEQG